MRRVLVALALLFVSACAGSHQSIKARFTKMDELLQQADPPSFADAPALGLFSEDGTMMVHLGNGEFYTQRLVHRAYLIQNEQGFVLADVRIILPPRTTLVGLRARHKKPGDKEWRELDPKDVIVDEAATGDADHTASGRLFRFADVEVGSLLEWSYVLEVPYLDTDSEISVSGDLPFRRWTGWVQAPSELKLDVRSYNAPQPSTDFNRDDDDLDHRWTVTMSAVPQRPEDEAFAADPSYTQPRLAYRVLEFNPELMPGRRFSFPVLPEWKDVFARWAYAAYFAPEHRLFDEPSKQLDVRGCQGAFCVAQRAHAYLNERTRYTGVGSWVESRKVYEVLSSRAASGFERMLIMKWLLEGAGVQAWLGGYTARNTESADSSFPTLDHLNRPMLYLPQQRGLDVALWVDPLCESCEPGTVAAEAQGVNAKLIEVRGTQRDGRPDVNVYDAPVVGSAGPPTFRSRQYQATVMQNGNVELEVHDERSGRLAVDFCSGEHEANHADTLHERARQLSETAQGTAALGADCDTAHGFARTGFKATLPAHAVTDGATLYVPLTLFEPDWRSTFAEETRELPIAFVEGARSMDYRIHVKAPPGFSLATKLTQERAAAPGMTAVFDARSAPGGADVVLSVQIEPGFHPASLYPQFRKVADFIRGARTRVLEFRK